MTIALTALLTIIGIVFLLSLETYKPIHRLQKLLENPQMLRERDTRSIRDLADKIIVTVNTNHALESELKERVSALQKLQVSALQIQMNPHFLFNSLTMINLSIVQELGSKHKSAEMVCKLSQLLHYGLESEGTVFLSTELHYTQIYLDIMRQRYSDLFSVEWQMDPATESAICPLLCLQPILENAIYHGLSPIENIRNGLLSVHGTMEGNDVLIQIEDNGVGMDLEHLHTVRKRLQEDPLLTSKHIGLRNVNSRLILLFGVQYGISINSEKNKGTRFFYVFPCLDKV